MTTDAATDNPPEISGFNILDDFYEIILPVPRVDPVAMARHVFDLTKCNLKAVKDLEDEITRASDTVGNKRERLRFEEDKAYGAHYLGIIAESFAQDYPTDTPDEWQKLTEEEIQDLRFEHRADAARALHECHVTVVKPKNKSILFERKDKPCDIILLIGEEDNPAYTIELQTGRPGGERRLNYRDAVQQVESERLGKNQTRRSVKFSVEAGVNLFREYFKTVTQGVVLGEATTTGEKPVLRLYTEADKDVFLKRFPPMWKARVADELVESYFDDSGK